MSNVTRNWKTSLLGVATLITVGLKVADNPRLILKADTIAEVTAGVGLIVAKDADKSGTVTKER